MQTLNNETMELISNINSTSLILKSDLQHFLNAINENNSNQKLDEAVQILDTIDNFDRNYENKFVEAFNILANEIQNFNLSSELIEENSYIIFSSGLNFINLLNELNDSNMTIYLEELNYIIENNYIETFLTEVNKNDTMLLRKIFNQLNNISTNATQEVLHVTHNIDYREDPETITSEYLNDREIVTETYEDKNNSNNTLVVKTHKNIKWYTRLWNKIKSIFTK